VRLGFEFWSSYHALEREVLFTCSGDSSEPVLFPPDVRLFVLNTGNPLSVLAAQA
jgi:hypothetical protein